MEKVTRPSYQWAWEHVTAHALITLLGLAGIVYVGVRIAEGYVWPSIATILLGLIYWRIGLYAITFMHRYYVHEQFKVKSAWVQVVSTLAFYSTLQSPIRIWRGWHRQHHDEVDTYKDRTSPVVHGAMHAHMLVWMRKQFIKPAPARYSKNLGGPEYTVAMKFEPYYLPLALMLAFGLPTLIAWIGWNDPIGGLGFGGFTRLLILLHTTWTINSLMHMKGEKMEGVRSATNSHSRLFTWLIVGEPNHARHHKWPDSYRFGTFDPGARMIEWMEKRGLVYDLKKARDLA
ncbi:hypothetical protein GW943_02540 [Candidatus Parcubacteria bacterium]|uniref:Fatty acid desaturase domain-containing protein n=1 Tax=Candidatus Kaiserbacteria bacterium CG10_big_fil_rev_8_21_14_0_10_47_16 TaxID=1974608 RepID=A0A2H0UDI4_9BACT|nr:hypothetical protein [Candidatus Parcubacteria bacterium]PIR84483.1 MAG: hypothetical protein COU16_02805 [Candidatus Kaiserbacteria bacterium CG10_big_fil_rev_8_21_14_0_10_47_16]